jgi:hypothetical protein
MRQHVNHPLRRQIHDILHARRFASYEEVLPPDYLKASEPVTKGSGTDELTARAVAFPPLAAS